MVQKPQGLSLEPVPQLASLSQNHLSALGDIFQEAGTEDSCIQRGQVCFISPSMGKGLLSLWGLCFRCTWPPEPPQSPPTSLPPGHLSHPQSQAHLHLLPHNFHSSGPLPPLFLQATLRTATRPVFIRRRVPVASD